MATTTALRVIEVNESFAQAKKALNASAQDSVVGRDNESDELECCLRSCLQESKPCSLYINGQPGTGKTLTVNHVLDELKKKSRFNFKQIFVNCMTIKNIQSLYKILTQELNSSVANLDGLTPTKRSSKENAIKTIDHIIGNLKSHVVLVLDEIDQIETSAKTSPDLYKIFEWPFVSNSKLILIGIANALDFTDRLLPRLELKPECKPRVVKFMPYSKEDIIKIVKDRLKKAQANGACIIEDAAITFCASKISSTSGDVRKVLDICRRAIEFIEKEFKQQNSASANESSVDFKPVKIAHIMKILNDINPMTNNNIINRATMPISQKILLCTILLCNKEMKIKDVPLSKLFDKFNKICKQYATAIESDSEFVNLCTLVQDTGLIELIKSKEKQAIRTYKVVLKLDEQELRDRLQDENFMNDILTNKLYK